MTEAKPFQNATVESVLKAFDGRRRVRRFLVADEVGLGKTVVAQHVIRAMMSRSDGPLVVFYMCSNLAIARQNRRKLLEVLPKDERAEADCTIDRLSLMLAYDRPTHRRLNLYSLTPDTSIPIRKKHRRDGRKEERALVHALVERVWPHVLEERGANLFRGNATTYWKESVKYQDARAAKTELREAFRRSVQKEFGLESGRHLLPVIRDLDTLELIGRFRNALAASALEAIKPHFVVYDEFQNFRDLFEQSSEDEELSQRDRSARRVIQGLRGDDSDDPPALLLLSATPYRLFTRRWEEEAGPSHRSEFFELVEFLYGGDADARKKRGACEAAFLHLETELRKGQAGSDEAKTARRQVEALLCPIMSRTERASHHDGWDAFETRALRAPVASEDLSVFKHLTRCFDDVHRAGAVPYWTSIPLPMQTMGTHYVAWKSATSMPADGVPGLSVGMRDRFQRPSAWPHPRLRALRELAPPNKLAVPWLAPTAPWWPLRGVWKNPDQRPAKFLIFSRFRAVPQAIAAALSFDLEAEAIAGERLTYADVTRRRLLSATESRHTLLGLFHPSPFLVEATDPLAARSQELPKVRQEVRRQLKRALSERDVSIRDSAHSPSLWRVLARLDCRDGNWPFVSDSWWSLQGKIATGESEDAGLAQLLTDWDEEARKPIDVIHPSTFEKLVEHALGAPGVVVGRSLRRHWPKAVTADGFYHALDASWTGLRNYLDQRWFYLALCRSDESYPEAIRRVVIEGNLEAVLDEHLWITSRLQALESEDLARELRDGLTLKSGLFYVHPLEDKTGDTFSIRCHVAMPFAQSRVSSLEQGEKPIRTDELRRAFNTPFWPYVLATTSVGQEGLDFHAWCDTLVHWDLCRNPVDLEQREGRIQRFGGLSIRRAIARELASRSLSEREAEESPWRRIESLANQTMSDESGLAPWWVCRGGGVTRYVFDVPTSEQKHWLHWMKEQRLLYRLALGQPNQEDLLEIISNKGGLGPNEIRQSVINLSPWFSR
jgi:hypothetical protein